MATSPRPGAPAPSAITIAAGSGLLTLSAPSPAGAGSTGSVDLALNLGAAAADQSCLAAHPASTGAALRLAALAQRRLRRHLRPRPLGARHLRHLQPRDAQDRPCARTVLSAGAGREHGAGRPRLHLDRAGRRDGADGRAGRGGPAQLQGALSVRGDDWRDQVLAALRQAQSTAQSHRRLVCATSPPVR